jgi:hypothetical protein
MAHRYPLAEVDKSDGTLWFTLVFEDYANLFVERYNDSDRSFMTDKIQNIPVKKFDRYKVNGIPLQRLVAAKLEEIHADEMELGLQAA